MRNVRKKAKAILRGRAGASMMFVLAALFLLWYIGASALNAAGQNAGAGAVKRIDNQLHLYANSMELTLKKLLEEEETAATLDDVKTLVGQMWKILYIQVEESASDIEPGTERIFSYLSGPSGLSAKDPEARFGPMTLTMDTELYDEVEGTLKYSITLSGRVTKIFFTRRKDYVPPLYQLYSDGYYLYAVEIKEAEPRVPQEARFLDGEITFIVETRWTPPGVNQQEQVLITETTFGFGGTVRVYDQHDGCPHHGLSSCPTITFEPYICEHDCPFDPAIDQMYIDNDSSYSWKRVFNRHEKIDR